MAMPLMLLSSYWLNGSCITILGVPGYNGTLLNLGFWINEISCGPKIAKYKVFMMYIFLYPIYNAMFVWEFHFKGSLFEVHNRFLHTASSIPFTMQSSYKVNHYSLLSAFSHFTELPKWSTSLIIINYRL